jgi:hypothetical protein
VQELQEKEAAAAAAPPVVAASGGSSNDKKRIHTLNAEKGNLLSLLQERDQSIRGTAQELDTLGFQNKQLSKRLELLQEDLTSKEAKSNRGSKSAKKSATEDALHLQEEELRRKIMENEGLHRRRQEEARGYEQKIRELQQQLEAAQAQLQEGQRSQTLKASEATDATQRFHLERVQLTQRLADAQSALAATKATLEQKETALKATTDSSTAQIQALNELASSKCFFDDTATPEFNALNVPPSDDLGSGKTSEINKQVLQGVRSFVSLFSNLLTYFEERAIHISAMQPDGMSKAAKECCAALNGHAKYIKPLDRSFTMYHDGAATLGPFAGAFSNFENYMKRLLPHMKHALEEENGFVDTTTMLKATNIAVIGAFQDVVVEISKMNGHVTGIGNQDTRTFANTQASVFAAVSGLSVVLTGFTALASHFSVKVAQEQKLARTTDKSKSTDAMISQALSAIVAAIEALVKVLEDNKSTLTAGTSYAVRGVPAASLAGSAGSPAVDVLEERARRFMRGLLCDPPDSVPYTEALALSKNGGARSAVRRSSISLTDQALSSPELNAKVSELEQEREHFKLECELLKMKLDRFEAVHTAGEKSRGSSGNSSGESPARGADLNTSGISLLRGGFDGTGSEEVGRIRSHYEGQ